MKYLLTVVMVVMVLGALLSDHVDAALRLNQERRSQQRRGILSERDETIASTRRRIGPLQHGSSRRRRRRNLYAKESGLETIGNIVPVREIGFGSGANIKTGRFEL
ncbi:uncharacterized protein LOC121429045 [Lytechinus variegatus]|uniref:uncharacterized protein LOC121429045 n=1 Tax=Lytechinus variegatus TaxID=7654 RepID=UPI001BB230B1|nr:uncharacterized protein LOC121429045 [Lytechinus variegatus]